MEIIRTVLIVVEVLICFLLIGLVLIQKTKGGGLGTAFGSGMGESLFGSRTGNVLTKATIVLGIAFLLNTMVLGILYTRKQDRSLIDQQLGGGPVPVTAPAQPTARPQEPQAQQPAPEASTPTMPGMMIDGSGNIQEQDAAEQ